MSRHYPCDKQLREIRYDKQREFECEMEHLGFKVNEIPNPVPENPHFDISSDEIQLALYLLPLRMREILEKRHLKSEMTYESIGRDYGIGKERTRQIHYYALWKLKKPYILRKWLGWNYRDRVNV